MKKILWKYSKHRCISTLIQLTWGRGVDKTTTLQDKSIAYLMNKIPVRYSNSLCLSWPMLINTKL